MLNNRTYPGSIRAVLAGLLLLIFSSGLSAQGSSSVWLVSAGANSLYLGGTVHLLRPTDFPLPEVFEQAYQDADVIYFETDISAVLDPAMQTRIMQELVYADGRTLQTVLSEEVYRRMADYLDEAGIPIALLESFRPGLLINTLQVIELQNLGFTPQGVDAYYYRQARLDGKNIGELEPIEAQIAFLAGLGEGNEDAFVMASLQEMALVAESMDLLLAAWRAGDKDILNELFISELQSQMPEVYETLLVGRNQDWLPQLQALLETGQDSTAFVLVGAAHLVGEDGLLQLLVELGYQVEQL